LSRSRPDFCHISSTRDDGERTWLRPAHHGERIGDIKKGFAAACQRAGLHDVTPHTLRHTCATWLMQKGTDPWQASGFLSMSMETLQRVYGHHHPEYQRQAAENVGRRPQNVRVMA
jgi:integrase